MSLSIRDQLAQLGFKPAAPESKSKPDRAPRPPREDKQAAQGKPSGRPPGKDRRRPPGRPGKGRGGQEMDLGKAYALRAQKEKEERIAAEQARQEAARLKREARAALAAYVKDKALNLADADIARHFEYGGKIKRIHVSADQLRALNAGELGVVQNEGRYLLVSAETLAEAERLFAPAVALKVDPDAPASDDPYADPQYRVPDDLVW